ncbi:MAG: M48 family metalloprotease [Myxococcaceae bacterium]
MSAYYGNRSTGRGVRLIIGLVIAGLTVVSYLSTRTHNEVTGEDQYVDLTPQQEIALGLSSVPEILGEYGGEKAGGVSGYVSDVGARIVQRSAAGRTPYQFKFHVLADANTINAFALPGGQVFITTGLLTRMGNEAELAGVLGHEIGHVVARHGAEHLAKSQLTQGLAAAYVVGADDPNDPYDTRRHAIVAAAVAQLINLKYSRGDELEADALGVRLMGEAGYDTHGMLELMQVLKAAGPHTPEFFSTHPDPVNRQQKIEQLLTQQKSGGDRNEAMYRARVLAALGASPKLAPRGEPVAKAAARVPGMRLVGLSRLPPEAQKMVALIVRGGPFASPRDGIEFQNRENALPAKGVGYYREYTVPTPGETDRGARRIVAGQGGELFYSSDHYATFAQIDPES